MPHHEYVEDVLQEIEIEDTPEIETNDTQSYFINSNNMYIYAKDRAFGSSNTYTLVYLYKDIRNLYYKAVSKSAYPYNMIVRQELGHCLA